MAFATQRAFLNVPYRNEEPPVPDRKRSDCQLKSYESCSDARAWSLDPSVCSKFLLDVVRKSRFQRKLSRPSGDYQLTRAYLQQLTTDELIDYVMSLMMELKQIKSQVQQIEAERNDLGEQLMSLQQMAETCEQEKEELILVQQRSAVFDPDQMDQDMIDLRNLLLALKEKADKYDCLEKENKCLKLKLDEFCGENTIKRNASFDEGACGDSVPLACEKLKAELGHYKQSYEEMKVQKRALMEQLQLTKLRECRYWEMKNRLAEEECKRACLQTRIDDLLIERDCQALDLTRKEEYISLCNRRLEHVESGPKRPSSAPTGQRTIQRQSLRRVSRRSTLQEGPSRNGSFEESF
ncbi:uncharacterized protein LOC110680246 [Aedes aegypti]|uniref:Uncharacterized protein n=1 Tax=Aedes aegypti TaxID=7159 RepID=A0A903VNV1_AEDAE|nr:uncharacterized protein LOC110680246 [Aedes aegypti]